MKRFVTLLLLLLCFVSLGVSTGYGQNRRREEVRRCNEQFRDAMNRARSLRGKDRRRAENEARREHDRCLNRARRR
ncbi:MAG TPA: hypothetical protein VFC63_07790 [Blastocatellia bacterium]|nr:hypothetical protein [Blastocatellia bacterium]